MSDDFGKEFAGFVKFFAILTFLAVALVLLFFFGIIIAVVAVVMVIVLAYYRAWTNKRVQPSFKENVAVEKTNKLVEDFSKVEQKLHGPNAMAKLMYDRLGDTVHHNGKVAFSDAAYELFEAELRKLKGDIEPPENLNSIAGIRYREQLKLATKNLEESDTVNAAFHNVFHEAMKQYVSHFPPSGEGPTVPAHTLCNDLPKAVGALLTPFYRVGNNEYTEDWAILEARKRKLFSGLCQQLSNNIYHVSREHLSRQALKEGELLPPWEYEGDDVGAYLRGTPLERLLDFPIGTPLLDANTRFEHMWIVAGSGHGKTQALLNLIWDDFDDVANNQQSVVVIDSQGDLINTISHLKRFGDGEDLDGRLVLIDPTDIEYPVQLNLFSLSEDLAGYEPLEREKLQNAAIELYEFILGSLLGAELTSKQSTMFRYALRAMLVIPGATIHTFRELFEPGGYEKYKEHIEKLSPSARAFFATEFTSREFEATNRQIVRRLWAVLESGVFERMFSHSTSKFNMFREMNSGKVILINTAKDLLKQNGTEIFGRFFIALLAQAAQERAVLPKNERLSCHVYIDECQDYLDENVSLILEQSRKYNVGITLAHQYLGQLSPKLFDSFATNTAQKFIGGVSAKDARVFAQMMDCEPEFIQKQPKGSFALHIRNQRQTAAFAFPLGFVEQQERMSDRRFAAIRALNRQRYAVHVSDLDSPEGPKPPRSGPDDMDTSPSPQW